MTAWAESVKTANVSSRLNCDVQDHPFWFRVSLSEQIFLIFFLSVHLSVQPHDLTTVLKVKSLPYQVNKIPPSLHHTSLSKRTAFISVMDRWTPRERSACYFLILLILFMGFLKRKTKHGTFIRSWWGEWQRSTHLTGPGANAVNLRVPFLITHARTHTLCSTVMCAKVCAALSRGLIHANQEPRGRRAALFGVRGGG